MSLGTAFALDYGLQFLLPVVLTRALDPHSFGEYRLLWLGISTLLMITPMCMPQTLYYFLPRSDSEKQRLYLNQCLIFMAFAGLLAAWALSPFDPFLPQSMRGLVSHHAAAVMLIAGLWIFSWVLDVLPTVDERVDWQARLIVSMSALRAVLLSAVAFVTRDLGAVLGARGAHGAEGRDPPLLRTPASRAARAVAFAPAVRRAGEACGAVRAFGNAARHALAG